MNAPLLSINSVDRNITELSFAKNEQIPDPIPGLFFDIFYTYNSPMGIFLNLLYNICPIRKNERYITVVEKTQAAFSYYLHTALVSAEVAKRCFNNPQCLHVSKGGLEQLSLVMRLGSICEEYLRWDHPATEEIKKECSLLAIYKEMFITPYSTALFPPIYTITNIAKGYRVEKEKLASFRDYLSLMEKVPNSVLLLMYFLKSLKKHQPFINSEFDDLLLNVYNAFPEFFHQRDPEQEQCIQSWKNKGQITLNQTSYRVETFYDFSIKDHKNLEVSYTIFHLQGEQKALLVPNCIAYLFLLLSPRYSFVNDSISRIYFYQTLAFHERHRWYRWIFIDKLHPLIPTFISAQCPECVETLMVQIIGGWFNKNKMPVPFPEMLSLYGNRDIEHAYPNFCLVKKFDLAVVEEFLYSQRKEKIYSWRPFLERLQREEQSGKLKTVSLHMQRIFEIRWLNPLERLWPKELKSIKENLFIQTKTAYFNLTNDVRKEFKYDKNLSADEKLYCMRHFLLLLHNFLLKSGFRFFVPKELLASLSKKARESRYRPLLENTDLTTLALSSENRHQVEE